MNDIENQIFGSRRIREFLKNFSEVQWSRLVKASVVMGIQELEKSQEITRLSLRDIEDLVGKYSLHLYPLKVQNESMLKESKTNSEIKR